MATCATATALSHVSMRGNYSYTAISAVVAVYPNQLDAEAFTEIIYTVPVNTIFMVPWFQNIVTAAQPRRGRDLVMQQFLLFATTNITTTQVSKEAFKSSVFLYLNRDET